MSERTPLLSQTPPAAYDPSQKMAGRFRRRAIRVALATLILTAGILVVLSLFGLALPANEPAVEKKVPLEAHIMSKCPDARDCLRELVLPTMQKVSDKVDFKLSFIGKVTNHDDGVECMHGQTECLGNILELCAASIYPDPKIYLGYTMCLSNQYHDIPEQGLLEDCALEHGMDFGKLNECMSRDDGAYAMGMLRESVTRSKEANVTKSCTVRVNEKIWCIRDGGEWKECADGSSPEDLESSINKLYGSSNGWTA